MPAISGIMSLNSVRSDAVSITGRVNFAPALGVDPESGGTAINVECKNGPEGDN